jgi:type IV secretory pathway VirB2 component (pilin)
VVVFAQAALDLPLQRSFADSADASVLAGAAQWVEGVLLGAFATSIATIAVAALGFAMLQGRVDVRRGITVLAGCFVLFGAGAIAAGLRGFAYGLVVEMPSADLEPAPRGPSQKPLPLVPDTSDPYAGASVPR